MNLFSKCITVLVFSATTSFSFAQNNQNREGLNFGINAGLIQTNKSFAEIYSVTYTLQSMLMSMSYYEQIEAAIGDKFSLYSNPIMRYTPSIHFGGLLQYYTSDRFAYFFDLEIVSRKATGEFQVELSNPSPTSFGPQLETGIVDAKEQAFMCNFGTHIVLSPISNSYLPYIDLGVHVSVLELLEQNATIAGVQIPLYTQNDFTESITNIGYGVVTGVGVQFPIQKFYLNAGLRSRLGYYTLDNTTKLGFHNSLSCAILF